jgi:hypothetical protein
MITMYYVLWATKAKQDYIGTYTEKATALEVATALDLRNYLIEPVDINAPLEIEIR